MKKVVCRFCLKKVILPCEGYEYADGCFNDKKKKKKKKKKKGTNNVR